MKFNFKILLCIGLCGQFLFSCSQQKSAKMTTEIDSVSYSLGINVGENLKKSGLKEVNAEVFGKAINDALKNDTNAYLIKTEAAYNLLNRYFSGLQKQKTDKNLKENQAFLEKNKSEKGVVTLPSGLQYQIITEGKGAKPTKTDKVKVHYRGTLIDGKEFDSSIERGQPAVFVVEGVIKGWQEALQLMSVGSKWKLFIPSELAYGERGAQGSIIEPNMALIFEVELLSIEKGEKNEKTKQK